MPTVIYTSCSVMNFIVNSLRVYNHIITIDDDDKKIDKRSKANFLLNYLIQVH